MQPIVQTLKLASLPKIPAVKAGKSRAPDKYSKEKIEDAINGILQGNPKADHRYIAQILRIMSRDSKWIKENNECAKKVMQAVTLSYFFDKSMEKKIQKIMKRDGTHLKEALRPDLKLLVGQSEIPSSALVLSVHSPFFDSMLKSAFPVGLDFSARLQKGDSLPLSMQDNPRIVTAFTSILESGKSDTLPTFTREELDDLKALSDQTLSNDTFIPMLEKALMRTLQEKKDKVLPYYDYAVDNQFMHNLQEACIITTVTNLSALKNISDIFDILLKIKELPNWAKVIPDIVLHLDPVFMKFVTVENAKQLYGFSNNTGLTLLREACLKVIFKDLNIQRAYEGAMKGVIQGVNLGQEDVREYCWNWFLTHFINGTRKLTRDAFTEKKGFSLSALKCNPFKKEDPEEKEDIEFTKKFFAITASLKKVNSSPILQQLSEEDLNSILIFLNPKILESLDLSGCQIKDGKLLVRFEYLKTLKISNAPFFEGGDKLYSMADLEIVDFSNCGNLQLLDLTACKYIKEITILGCSNLNDDKILGVSRRLAKVSAEPNLHLYFEGLKIPNLTII